MIIAGFLVIQSPNLSRLIMPINPSVRYKPNKQFKHKVLNFTFQLISMNEEEMLALKRPIVEACIKSAQKKGWSDGAGVLRGILFLETKPMSLDMLAEKTGYSKTTIRSNMNFLENRGIVRRVVDPLGKKHRYKQYRYALVDDVETMRMVVLSAAKEEVNLILQALVLMKKNLGDCSTEKAELGAYLDKSIQFYEEMSESLGLISQFTSKELIEILKSKKRDSLELQNR
jgi:DNA-binding transcriptional regulator GbsR (MarR family)